MTTRAIEHPTAVSRAEWEVARKLLLAKEEEYIFDPSQGKRTLADLFADRSQLIVYHFMWRRDSGDGYNGCSFLADHIDGANLHLAHHDVSLGTISRVRPHDRYDAGGSVDSGGGDSDAQSSKSQGVCHMPRD